MSTHSRNSSQNGNARRHRKWMTCLVILFICGCAMTPYRYGRLSSIHPAQTCSEPVEICHGQPNQFLDGLGNIVGIKSKILPLNVEVNNHHITDETLGQLVEYLEKNEITDVYVSVNEYAPKDQWGFAQKMGQTPATLGFN